MFSMFEKPNFLLKFEGFAVLLVALAIYWRESYSWPLFGETILLPDIAFFGYLINAKIGAIGYNITHSKPLPSAIGVVGIITGNTLYMALALIWLAHIGIDRMLGYGLKYPEGFKITHLGVIGQGSGVRISYLPCGK
jgi:hypothetical protein